MSSQHIDITIYFNTPLQEALRVLGTNLELNKKYKAISIVSYEPGEGKTFLSINLAITVAKSGTKVLYVDADLRKPKNIKRHGHESLIGLTDFCEETNIEEIVCKTDLDNLDVIATGNRFVDPVEFLCSQNFDGFIEKAFEVYDMVLLDSPSMGLYVDGAIIAAKAAGVLIVTSAQKTRYQNIERIKWQMENVGAKIIGIVINRVKKRDFKAYFISHKKYKYLLPNNKRSEIGL